MIELATCAQTGIWQNTHKSNFRFSELILEWASWFQNPKVSKSCGKNLFCIVFHWTLIMKVSLDATQSYRSTKYFVLERFQSWLSLSVSQALWEPKWICEIYDFFIENVAWLTDFCVVETCSTPLNDHFFRKYGW